MIYRVYRMEAYTDDLIYGNPAFHVGNRYFNRGKWQELRVWRHVGVSLWTSCFPNTPDLSTSVNGNVPLNETLGIYISASHVYEIAVTRNTFHDEGAVGATGHDRSDSEYCSLKERFN